LEGWLFITGSETKIVVAHETSDGVMIVTPVIDALIDALDQQFDVMILDPFVRSHGVKENSNEAIDRVVATLADAARMTNIAIGLVHHTHKLYGVKVTMEASRGASSMVGAIRAGRVLDVMSEQEAKNFGFSERARFSYFRAEDGKTSMSKRAESADWYEIVSVGLGNGSGSLLDDQDRVGVVAKWEPLDLLADVPGGDFDKAATAIRGGRWRENAQAKDWAGRAIAMALSLDLDKPGDKAKVKALLKMWLGSDALIVVEEHDEKSMLRKFVKVANDED
jgi:hypothetical protein